MNGGHGRVVVLLSCIRKLPSISCSSSTTGGVAVLFCCSLRLFVLCNPLVSYAGGSWRAPHARLDPGPLSSPSSSSSSSSSSSFVRSFPRWRARIVARGQSCSCRSLCRKPCGQISENRIGGVSETQRYLVKRYAVPPKQDFLRVVRWNNNNRTAFSPLSTNSGCRGVA
jgi:hypothetical protein